MAHIASCVAGADQTSPQSPPSQSSSAAKPHSWRMLPSEQQCRYQLFPKSKPPPAASSGKGLDPEKAFAYAMADKADKANVPTHLRLRPTQSRQRKLATHDPSHMTTVHELPMDSPTIPGRVALHERSISAPKEKTGFNRAPLVKDRRHHWFTSSPPPAEPAVEPSSLARSGPSPLVIPSPRQPAPLLQSKASASKLRSDSAPPRRSPCPALEDSPSAPARYTPSVSTPDLSLPRSATTDGHSVTALTHPVSAPSTDLYCVSPESWDGSSSGNAYASYYPSGASPYGAACGHQRRASESSGMMDRGRPLKRDARPSSKSRGDRETGSLQPAPPVCSECARDKSLERRAFEDLPRGWKPRDVPGKLSLGDTASLRKQAYRQAERFEVLKADDVNSLSKELRQLDERTEHLRSTYKSLRAGRRNLHSRICQYLRSPRTTRFSQETMLRQEEALTELDDSIDDWINKLEHAENRRTRIRQKLLEHVAAATLLPGSGNPATSCESLQQIMGVRSPAAPGISTPPRSPTRQPGSKSARGESPALQRVVDQVPRTIIEQPVAEAEQAAWHTRGSVAAGPRRADVESIRVYVGGDVFALLADVEDEISRMSSQAAPAETTSRGRRQGSESSVGSSDASASVFVLSPSRDPASRATAAREGFHEMLATLPPPPPPLKDAKTSNSEFLLTSAVFKP